MFILFLLCLSHVLSKHSLFMKTWATMVAQHICSLSLTMENLHCPLKSGLLGYLPGNWMDFQLAPFVWFGIWVLVFFWGTRISERPVPFQKLWRIRDLSFLSQELWKAPWEFPPLLEPRFLISFVVVIYLGNKFSPLVNTNLSHMVGTSWVLRTLWV